jgi:hypothetical protein
MEYIDMQNVWGHYFHIPDKENSFTEKLFECTRTWTSNYIVQYTAIFLTKRGWVIVSISLWTDTIKATNEGMNVCVLSSSFTCNKVFNFIINKAIFCYIYVPCTKIWQWHQIRHNILTDYNIIVDMPLAQILHSKYNLLVTIALANNGSDSCD